MRFGSIGFAALLGLAGCELPASLPSAKEMTPKVSFDKLKIDAITFQKVDTTSSSTCRTPSRSRCP